MNVKKKLGIICLLNIIQHTGQMALQEALIKLKTIKVCNEY